MTRGELLYRSHGDVCQKIIAPKEINMGVAQVFDPWKGDHPLTPPLWRRFPFYGHIFAGKKYWLFVRPKSAFSAPKRYIKHPRYFSLYKHLASKLLEDPVYLNNLSDESSAAEIVLTIHSFGGYRPSFFSF